jgi:hypothetical protein
MGESLHNEKLKLRAAFLNNLEVAAFAGGILAPAFDRVTLPSVLFFTYFIFGAVISLLLHSGAILGSV